jgi:hypothetical protein
VWRGVEGARVVALTYGSKVYRDNIGIAEEGFCTSNLVLNLTKANGFKEQFIDELDFLWIVEIGLVAEVGEVVEVMWLL